MMLIYVSIFYIFIKKLNLLSFRFMKKENFRLILVAVKYVVTALLGYLGGSML